MRKDERDALATIAAEVRRARKERGWSQLELAEHAGLSLNYVSLIERGEQTPTLRVLLQIAKPLGLSLRDLIVAPCDAERTEKEDPWLMQATAILRGLAPEARPVALGVLRSVADTLGTKRAGGRKRRGHV